MNIILQVKKDLHEVNIPIPVSYVQFYANGLSSASAHACHLDCFLNFEPIWFLHQLLKMIRNPTLHMLVEPQKDIFMKLYFFNYSKHLIYVWN